jgi:phosphoserine phosphatase
MTAPQNTIAVIFDFDDTLTDDSTTAFLTAHGIDAARFWTKDMKARVDDGWDPTLGYLDLLLRHVGPDRPLGSVTLESLQAFGAKLKFYPGLPKLFDDLRAIAAEHVLSNPTVEFYVISGGLEPVIAGSKLAKWLTAFWGCRFATDPAGMINGIKRAISFTEKTRYLFEINKGLSQHPKPGPYDVNEGMSETMRRIPFRNMIYIGDGLTDVPCFSLVQRFGGKAFGVFDPRKQDSPKKGLERLVTPRRVMSLNSPRYGKTDDLGRCCAPPSIRFASTSICGPGRRCSDGGGGRTRGRLGARFGQGLGVFTSERL